MGILQNTKKICFLLCVIVACIAISGCGAGTSKSLSGCYIPVTKTTFNTIKFVSDSEVETDGNLRKYSIDGKKITFAYFKEPYGHGHSPNDNELTFYYRLSNENNKLELTELFDEQFEYAEVYKLDPNR